VSPRNAIRTRPVKPKKGESLYFFLQRANHFSHKPLELLCNYRLWKTVENYCLPQHKSIPMSGYQGDIFWGSALVSNRSVKITQAELERALRAVTAQGLPIARIIARADGYVIETAAGLVPNIEPKTAKPKPVL
jgi:hypothetical protein